MQNALPQGYAQPQTEHQPQPFVPPVYDTNPRISQFEQELAQLKRELQIQQLRQRFLKFDEVLTDVLDLAETYGYDMEIAFGKMLVDRWNEIMNNVQQQTVDNIRKKGTKQVEPSNAPSTEDDPLAQLTSEELEAARALRIDPKDYAQAKKSMNIVF